MAISSKLIKYLEASKYKYELVKHRTTYTAYDTAQTTKKYAKGKFAPDEIVKTLVIKLDNDYALAMIPARKRLDKKKLLKIINSLRKKEKIKAVKKLDFAKEVWMKKNILGKVGAVPPFREIVKLPIYLDNALARQNRLYLGSGEYETSVQLKTKQYLKIENPVKGNFAAKGK